MKIKGHKWITKKATFVKTLGDFKILRIDGHYEAFDELNNGKFAGSGDTLKELEEDLKRDYGERAE